MIDFNDYTIIPIQKFIINYLLDMEIPVNIDKMTHKLLKEYDPSGLKEIPIRDVCKDDLISGKVLLVKSFSQKEQGSRVRAYFNPTLVLAQENQNSAQSALDAMIMKSLYNYSSLDDGYVEPPRKEIDGEEEKRMAMQQDNKPKTKKRTLNSNNHKLGNPYTIKKKSY
jgi:hypothetical protein